MGQCHSAFNVVYDYRLSVAAVIGTRCAVTDMTDCDISFTEGIYDFTGKDIVYKPYVFISAENAVIVNDNSARLLSTVLKCVKSVVDSAGDIALFG